jgi:hypothetical protein
MIIFATEHILLFLLNIEDTDTVNGFILTLEYFILGISSILCSPYKFGLIFKFQIVHLIYGIQEMEFRREVRKFYLS